jgi:hypothetical protein
MLRSSVEPGSSKRRASWHRHLNSPSRVEHMPTKSPPKTRHARAKVIEDSRSSGLATWTNAPSYRGAHTRRCVGIGREAKASSKHTRDDWGRGGEGGGGGFVQGFANVKQLACCVASSGLWMDCRRGLTDQRRFRHHRRHRLQTTLSSDPAIPLEKTKNYTYFPMTK